MCCKLVHCECERYWCNASWFLSLRFSLSTFQILHYKCLLKNNCISVCRYSNRPVWRVLLAVSVLQLGLSVNLNQVQYHPSTRPRKISSFPAWSGFFYGPSDWVSLSVQLHLNRLKGSNVWYKAQTLDTAVDIKLASVIHYHAAFSIAQSV